MAGLLGLVGAFANSSGGFLKDESARAYIIPLKKTGSGDADNARSFQFWPAELSDNQAINYANKQIPGSNLPFYQWISGGEHIVSFTATFAADLQYSDDRYDVAIHEDKHTVDVAAAVKWLRFLCYPDYIKNQEFADPPPSLILVFPNTPIGQDMSDRMNCIMTQCDVTWKKWFPDGSPRLAEVQLSFAEIVQLPKNTRFYGRTSLTGWQKRYKMVKGIKQ